MWEGNIMVARLVILCIIYASKGAMWVVEQPQGSLLEARVIELRVPINKI